MALHAPGSPVADITPFDIASQGHHVTGHYITGHRATGHPATGARPRSRYPRSIPDVA
ncbi:hypothetical protein IFJ82_00490 [Novacetimonas hansenii]|uniref:Uncharacterized protein n=3 Tax=Novacetimonas TaxID=2919364 RepID=A0AAW5EU88_NOVHA|nr:hypothetical protein [Novacetimonas hansenii]EFG85863.1 hypothetical protein GXY_01318 [Novacetimonas hansenii ATCC 23769]MCJ8355233.1 hypothetical protein [Novacetimonas hansenii]QOF95247.1 hypothetical protein IFJ82_00490 [Novacetimonas hansenii]WEQ58043.1 hypothetical protein LV563_09105 [Novacetimonas hansenii]